MKEIKTFDAILLKRNLLVHHGGFYTLKLLKQQNAKVRNTKNVFKEAVRIDTEDFHTYWYFLFDIAAKITRSTTQALRNKLQNRSLINEHYTTTIEVLLQAVHDTLDD